MNTYIDERGPYVLEMVSNADLRQRHSMASYWATTLEVSPCGRFALVKSYGDEIQYHPHMGEGEPRP